MDGFGEVRGIGIGKGLIPHSVAPVRSSWSWFPCREEALDVHSQAGIHGYSFGLSQRVGRACNGAVFELLLH
eukprot:2760756-Prorocentrum_lima.AAC.1